MRSYLVILMATVGLGIVVGAAFGYLYGVGTGLMLGAFLLLIHNLWRGWTGTN